jgi:hypothetical protein
MGFLKYHPKYPPFYPIVLPATVYDDATTAGHDMTDFVRQQTIPVDCRILVPLPVATPKSYSAMNRHERRVAARGSKGG